MYEASYSVAVNVDSPCQGPSSGYLMYKALAVPCSERRSQRVGSCSKEWNIPIEYGGNAGKHILLEQKATRIVNMTVPTVSIAPFALTETVDQSRSDAR